MDNWRKIALTILAALMILGILLTWGSIFSIVMALGLFSAAAMLLIRKHILNDRDNDWYGDQNG